MKEVKSPKKPLIYYYSIVLLLILIFNFTVAPLIMQVKVKEVDYGTFMQMIKDNNIGSVEIEDSQIIFTDKDEKNIYKTGAMDDPTLTERLFESGAKFKKDIEKTTSPLLSFLLTFILPMLVFIGIGQFLAKNSSLRRAAKTRCLSVWAKATQKYTSLLPTAYVLTTLPARTKQKKTLPRL